MDLNFPAQSPPNKRIKAEEEISELINECFQIRFTNNKFGEQKERLDAGLKKIRQTLEQVTSSSDVSLGPTRLEAKRNWGKCLGIMLENTPESLEALNILNVKLTAGGGLF